MSFRSSHPFIALLVATLTFVVFKPTLTYEFVNWDDNAYVYQNPSFHPLTFSSLGRLVVQPYFRSWTPVAFLSHAADVALWQFNPFGHHLTNVLLHSINAVLVFWLALHLLHLFRRKQEGEPGEALSSSLISGSVIAALVFALHPLRAESVAWVSDRKDLLCGMFTLLTALVYFSRRENPAQPLSRYSLLVLFYLLALGSKSIAMMLPVVFLLCDFLFFKKNMRESLKELVPLFILAAGAGVMARVASPDLEPDVVVGGKTTLQLIVFPFSGILFYVMKLLFPAGLSPVYHANEYVPGPESPMLVIAPLLVLAITLVCVWKMKQGRSYWILAWSAFVLFILPTFLGLLSGIQPVADRYTYIASISAGMMVGGAAEWMFRPHRNGVFGLKSRLMLALCVFTLSLLSYATMRQIRVWKNSTALWTYVIPRAPFPLAYNNMGMVQLENKKYDDALRSFEQALKLKPQYADAFYNMGVAYHHQGDREKAIASYRQAIRVKPDYLDAYINLGTEFLDKGMVDSALAQYRRALSFDSTFAKAHYTIAQTLVAQKRYDEGISSYRKSLAFDPTNADAWYNLGVAYEKQAHLDDAIASYAHCIALKPQYLDALLNLGNAYMERGDPAKAIETYARAIAAHPNSADAYYNLGYALYSVGDVPRARSAFEAAIRSDSSCAKAYHNLAVVYDHEGNAQEAIAMLRRAAQLGFEESQQQLRTKGISW